MMVASVSGRYNVRAIKVSKASKATKDEHLMICVHSILLLLLPLVLVDADAILLLVGCLCTSCGMCLLHSKLDSAMIFFILHFSNNIACHQSANNVQ